MKKMLKNGYKFILSEELGKKARVFVILFLAILFVLIEYLVYKTGGVKYVYAHTMYIFIILSAIFFKIYGGVIAGIIGGLGLGPFMPLDVLNNKPQNMFNWIYRMLIFVAIGFILGSVIKYFLYYSKKFRWLSLHDIETSLPNQTKLEIDLNEIKEDFNILLISFKNFGKITDLIGYKSSLKLLKKFINRITENLTQNILLDNLNLLYYLERKRFAVVIKKNIDVKIKAEELLKEFQQIILVNEIPYYIEICISVVKYPEHANSCEEIINKAKIAAYLNEKSQDAIYFYAKGKEQKNKNMMELIGEFKDALSDNQLKLYLQPKVNLFNGKIESAEALIRWIHPKKGFIPPDDFIPHIENTGLIRDLTFWVLNRALQIMSKWKISGQAIDLSINVSTKNLIEDDFCKILVEKLEEYDIQKSSFEIEVTETSFTSNNKVIEMLEKIKKTGINISIDDFGTGYSSFEYLKEFPANIIKIDKGFVMNVVKNKYDLEIVKSSINIGKVFNKKIIAEGVENLETINLLKKMGCDVGQGYFISKPLPEEEAFLFIKNYNLKQEDIIS